MNHFFHKLFLVLLMTACIDPGLAQPARLVIVISVDLFPYDYLTRFQPYFSRNGFNYLLQAGATFSNARYGDAFPKTAPAHSAIVTGSYSRVHGIVGNRWYDRDTRTVISSVDDASTTTIGGSDTSGRSPRNLETYTIGDMLRLHTNFRSKVISISAKDRSAILMGGKFGRAFWLQDSVVVSSSYYDPSLPSWVRDFNRSGAMQRYFGGEWTELNPSAASRICDIDDAPYEGNLFGLGRTFPHIITGHDRETITPSYYLALSHSPYSTELLLELSRRAVEAESLGTRGITDILCIGISATDNIGHQFGPSSREVFDDIVRTDRMLADFFSFIDRTVGLTNTIIVLTSDHGIAPIPEYLQTRSPGVRAGRVRSADIRTLSEQELGEAFGSLPPGRSWIEQVIETEIYINREVLDDKRISLELASTVLRDSLLKQPYAFEGYTAMELTGNRSTGRFTKNLQRAFYRGRSGDVFIILRPFYIVSSLSHGTNHGMPYDYDTHVPLLITGRNIRPGKYEREVSPTDIAPTLSALLGIQFPPGRDGRVLEEALR